MPGDFVSPFLGRKVMQRAPAAVRAPHRFVGFAELPLGIPDAFDRRMAPQALGQQQAALVVPLHPLRETPRLRVQHHGILAPQQFLVLRARWA